MTDVVILTARFGHGHLSAAQNIAEALQESYPALSAVVLDPLEMAQPRFYSFSRWVYRFVSNRLPKVYYWFYHWSNRSDRLDKTLLRNKAIRRVLRQLLDTHRPSVVVTTYPVYPFLLEKCCHPDGIRSYSIFSVITDSVSINMAWLRGDCDRYLVAEHLSALTLEKMGIPGEMIIETGFPTPIFFSRQFRPGTEPGLANPDAPITILFIPNQGRRYLFKILEVLGNSPAIKVIMALGDRPRLIRRVGALGQRLKCQLEVLGWVPHIYRRMLEADVVITKAGGATVHEALAAGCPVVISQVTPGQEEGNARLIESLGLGMVVSNDQGLHKLMEFFQQVDFNVLANMKRNVMNFHRVEAPHNIARIIGEHVRDRSDVQREANPAES